MTERREQFLVGERPDDVALYLSEAFVDDQPDDLAVRELLGRRFGDRYSRAVGAARPDQFGLDGRDAGVV